MTSLFYGAVGTFPVPADENIVRMTTAPVTPDAPPAMADTAPDPQEVETDPNPLLGLATRQVASTWHPSEKAAPEWSDRASAPHNALVNDRIASSGTAAQREASGQFGHGTLAFAEGIEPVGDLRDGGRLSNEYFTVNARSIQPTAGQYMSPVPDTSDTSNRVASAGKDASREATAAAYRDFWEGFKNGN